MNTLRHASACCVLRIMAIVGCILLTARIHRVMRTIYGNEGWYMDHTRYSIWIRDFGAWLLVIPVVWILIAACAYSQASKKKIEASSFTLTILVCLAVFFGLVQAFRTPMIYSIQKWKMSLAKQWGEVDCLSRVLLAQASRQETVSLAFDVRQ